MWIFGEPNIMYAEFNWPDGLCYAVKHCFDLIFLASIQGETVGFMSFVRDALDEGIKVPNRSPFVPADRDDGISISCKRSCCGSTGCTASSYN